MRKLALFSLALAGLALAAPSFAQEGQSQPAGHTPLLTVPADFNSKIYYKNKLEFSFDTGWLSYNTPFIFNRFMGEAWDRTPLDYTLVPLILSLRWHLYDPCGPSFLRGNTDLTFSGAYTVIPQGPESRYAAYMMGFRYNFIQPDWRFVPYLEARGGLGFIDARGPQGVQWAQGQDFTFNLNLGGGIRYNFDSRYSVSAGITYMHISNCYLSEPKTNNYGINVVGPTIGFNVGF